MALVLNALQTVVPELNVSLLGNLVDVLHGIHVALDSKDYSPYLLNLHDHLLRNVSIQLVNRSNDLRYPSSVIARDQPFRRDGPSTQLELSCALSRICRRRSLHLPFGI